MKRYIIQFIACLVAFTPVYSQAFVVSDIKINGLQRVSSGTVLNALPIDVGDNVDGNMVAKATKALFHIGYFQDISMGHDGDVLVVNVLERPAISKIDLKGNKSIKKEDLMKGLRQAGLSEGEIFQQATLDSVRIELERQYVAQGRYGVKISTKVVPQPRNRVSIEINIREGSVAQIKAINVVGNSVFNQQNLLDLFQLKTTHFSSWFSNDDKYSREKLSGDLERLRSYYLDRGYINFNIDSTQVSITPNKEQVYITINISEGKKYTVNDVKILGDFVVPEADLQKLLTVQKGQIFSRKKISQTEDKITRRLGDEGYTFANVTGSPTPDAKNDTVDITFFIAPGKRAYVRRINYVGNTKTEDEVLRREMRQMEGGLASTYKIQQSKTRLDRLGFFKQVNVQTPAVPGTSDQIDVNYTVEEQASGSIKASVGFSQGSGLILGGNISQNNFLGTGNRVSFGVNRSDYRTLYNFSFLDPYYTVDGVSRGYNVYYSTSDYDDTDLSSYSTDTWGGNINFGYPISETSRIGFSFGVEDIKVKKGNDPAVVVSDYLDQEGDDAFNFTTQLNWGQSELNRGLLPTDGFSQNASLELSLPGSDVSYYKVKYQGQRFFPLSDDWVLHFRSEAGYAGVYGDESRLPFYENYYGGGFGSVRGYKANTLGPQARALNDASYDPIGGNVIVDGSAELIFPFPFVKDRSSLRSSFFIDTGNVFDTDCQDVPVSSTDPTNSVNNCSSPKISELRYSAGVGVTWVTALGPLQFSIAKALNSKSEDETQVFQFSLGGTF